jgi:hypothetical protein
MCRATSSVEEFAGTGRPRAALLGARLPVDESDIAMQTQLILWIGKSVWWKITVCDPFDAPGKLAVGLNEFLDGCPGFLKGDEQSYR